jgi:hypothetical protein
MTRRDRAHATSVQHRIADAKRLLGENGGAPDLPEGPFAHSLKQLRRRQARGTQAPDRLRGRLHPSTRLRRRGRGVPGGETTEDVAGDRRRNRGQPRQGRGDPEGPPGPLRPPYGRGREGGRKALERGPLASGFTPKARRARRPFPGGVVRCGMAVWRLASPYRGARHTSQSTRAPHVPDVVWLLPGARRTHDPVPSA